ncbi:MAG TPA: rhodanese-like domain-containing protein [Saprospiraceae bacterium]|nr:rhodanese-like domain-containing protein [Saprospiraceae bacterium]
MGFFDFLFGKKQSEGVDFKKMAQDGALLLDVRTKEEFDAGHIDGAINIDHNVIKNHLDEIRAYNKPVIAYCRSGRRSGIATNILNKAGIKTVNGGGFVDLQEILK